MSRVLALAVVGGALAATAADGADLHHRGSARTAGHPAPSHGPPIEEGVASWYGGFFHGRLTASGERYDQGDMTAAHPTLPFGSLLIVTNLDNGRATIVRVNDRGPYVPGRIVDCSAAAADDLGFRGRGLACVRLEVLSPAPVPAAASQAKISPPETSPPATDEPELEVFRAASRAVVLRDVTDSP